MNFVVYSTEDYKVLRWGSSPLSVKKGEGVYLYGGVLKEGVSYRVNLAASGYPCDCMEIPADDALEKEMKIPTIWDLAQ